MTLSARAARTSRGRAGGRAYERAEGDCKAPNPVGHSPSDLGTAAAPSTRQAARRTITAAGPYRRECECASSCETRSVQVIRRGETATEPTLASSGSPVLRRPGHRAS